MSTSRSSDDALPPGARRFVLVVAIIATGILAVSVRLGIDEWDGALAPPMAILVVLAVGSILLPLRYHTAAGVQGFNLTVGVAVGLIAVVPDAIAIPSIAGAAFVGSAIASRSWIRSLFNASQEAVWALAAVTAGRFVVGWSDVGILLGSEVPINLLDRDPTLAIAVAVATALLVNSLAMSELFHQLQGTPRLEAVRATLNAATFVSLAGDIVVALLIVVLAQNSSLALLLATPLFAGLLFGFRGLEASRQAGRQARRLHDTSRSLLAGAVDDDGVTEAVDGLRGLFQAEFSMLDLGDGRTLGGPATDSAVVTSLAQARTSGRPVLVTDGAGVLSAPVVLDARVIGAVAVAGRRGVEDWGEADVELLGTVAGEVAATLRARQLYTDVERERAALAIESQRLGDILHGASDGILLLDDIGRVEACNPAMGAVVGALPEDVIGRRWDDVLRMEDDDGTPIHATSGGRFSNALAGLGNAVAEVRLRQSDGGWRWLRCSVASVSRDDELVGVVLVAVDLTSQREVAELRGDFLATVSHELRTPLTPLKGFLAILEAHADRLTEDRLQSIHGSMNKQLDRLEDLIGDLLLVAELDGGAPRVDIVPLDLLEAVEGVIATEAPTDDLRERLSVSVPAVEVQGDETGLRRTLRSLVSNGLKHTEGEVYIRAFVEGREVVVEVEDEGPGIAEADRDVVFEPFRRLGNHLHRTQGPGLGLAIARSLTEAIGGSLVLGRTGPPGAVFVLRLPHDTVPASRGNGRRPESEDGTPPR